jgi:Sulfatase
VLAHLKKTKQLDNTLIFFLSDNGGCAEWDPWGFDESSGPKNMLHSGADLKTVGGPQSYISYGSGWANVSNTPWRLYKHYNHEGGIRTPLIVHWPEGVKTKPGALTTQPGYITDFMPTLLELCGASYPSGKLALEGVNLTPALVGKPLPPRLICIEHEGNKSVRDGDWKLVGLSGKPWELYNLKLDPTELTNLASREPARVAALSRAWDAWVERCNVVQAKPETEAVPTPQIANKALLIQCDLLAESRNGVVLAQGGQQNGYALHLKDGKLIFSVRIEQELTTITASEPLPLGRCHLEARLARDGAMTLLVNAKTVAMGKASGLIPTQPQDGLSIGRDEKTAVGDYTAPNSLSGTVTNVKVSPLINPF